MYQCVCKACLDGIDKAKARLFEEIALASAITRFDVKHIIAACSNVESYSAFCGAKLRPTFQVAITCKGGPEMSHMLRQITICLQGLTRLTRIRRHMTVREHIGDLRSMNPVARARDVRAIR